MHDPDKINPACEHRMTAMETLLANHIPHVNEKLGEFKGNLRKIEKILWGIVTFFIIELIGFLIFLIKGHIQF